MQHALIKKRSEAGNIETSRNAAQTTSHKAQIRAGATSKSEFDPLRSLTSDLALNARLKRYIGGTLRQQAIKETTEQQQSQLPNAKLATPGSKGSNFDSLEVSHGIRRNSRIQQGAKRASDEAPQIRSNQSLRAGGIGKTAMALRMPNTRSFERSLVFKPLNERSSRSKNERRLEVEQSALRTADRQRSMSGDNVSRNLSQQNSGAVNEVHATKAAELKESWLARRLSFDSSGSSSDESVDIAKRAPDDTPRGPRPDEPFRLNAFENGNSVILVENLISQEKIHPGLTSTVKNTLKLQASAPVDLGFLSKSTLSNHYTIAEDLTDRERLNATNLRRMFGSAVGLSKSADAPSAGRSTSIRRSEKDPPSSGSEDLGFGLFD